MGVPTSESLRGLRTAVAVLVSISIFQERGGTVGILSETHERGNTIGHLPRVSDK